MSGGTQKIVLRHKISIWAAVLWNGSEQIAPLGQDVRDEVMDKLSKGAEEGSGDDPKAFRYEGVGLVNFKTNEDKVAQRLRDLTRAVDLPARLRQLG